MAWPLLTFPPASFSSTFSLLLTGLQACFPFLPLVTLSPTPQGLCACLSELKLEPHLLMAPVSHDQSQRNCGHSPEGFFPGTFGSRSQHTVLHTYAPTDPSPSPACWPSFHDTGSSCGQSLGLCPPLLHTCHIPPPASCPPKLPFPSSWTMASSSPSVVPGQQQRHLGHGRNACSHPPLWTSQNRN